MKHLSLFISALSIFASAICACTKEAPSDSSSDDNYIVPVEDNSVYVDVDLPSIGGAMSISFTITFSENTDYVNLYRGEGLIGNPIKYKKSQEITFSYLDPDTEYCYTLIPYNKDGKAGKSKVIKIKTASAPYENYFYYKGDFFEVTSVSTSVDRNSGNCNWKNLRFNTRRTTEFVLFTWHNYYYEGIDSYWENGTYNIQSSGNVYDYIGWFNNGSGIKSADGTLNIKSVSGGRLFTFTLYYGSPVIGRVLTKK